MHINDLLYGRPLKQFMLMPIRHRDWGNCVERMFIPVDIGKTHTTVLERNRLFVGKQFRIPNKHFYPTLKSKHASDYKYRLRLNTDVLAITKMDEFGGFRNSKIAEFCGDAYHTTLTPENMYFLNYAFYAYFNTVCTSPVYAVSSLISIKDTKNENYDDGILRDFYFAFEDQLDYQLCKAAVDSVAAVYADHMYTVKRSCPYYDIQVSRV